jgi:flagellar basal body-associated protein FliL
MAEEGAMAPPAPEAPVAAPSGGKSKKWLWIGIAAAAVAVIAVACVLVFVVFSDDIFGGLTKQEQTVQKMFDAMEAKNVDAFIAVMDPKGLEQLAAAGTSAADFKTMLSEEMTYDSMEFSGVKMETKVADDGQTATVTVLEGKLTTVEAGGEPKVEDVKDSGETQEYQVILRDGKWYLDISSM